MAVRKAVSKKVRGVRAGTTRPVVGIDLGGTNINVGVVGADGAVIAGSRVNRKTQAILGVEAVINRIADAVKESCELCHIDIKKCGGVGIGAPGAVDPSRGVVLKAVNLGFTNIMLAERLGKKVGSRVYLENDVNAAAYGEWRHGAAVGQNDMLAVWIGTGVGGGMVLSGRLYGGGYFTAGEIGHMTLIPNAPFGRRSLEQNCSRTAIAERLMALVASGHASILRKSMEEERKKIVEKGDFDPSKLLRSKHIAAAFKQQDPLTLRVVEESAALLGTAIAGVVTLLSLPCVVLGGGFTEALGEDWVRLVRRETRERVFPPELRKVEVLGTKLMDEAGIVGAAMLARENL